MEKVKIHTVKQESRRLGLKTQDVSELNWERKLKINDPNIPGLTLSPHALPNPLYSGSVITPSTLPGPPLHPYSLAGPKSDFPQTEIISNCLFFFFLPNIK